MRSGRLGLGVGAAVVAAIVGCGGSGGSSSNRGQAAAPVSPVTTGTLPGTPPSISVQTPLAPVVSATVAFQVVITDFEGDPAHALAEFSVDEGRTFWPATLASAGPLTTSPTGEAHALVWDAAQDVGRTLRHFVRLRVSALDPDGVSAPAETATFTLDATALPVGLANLVVPLDPAGPDRVVAYDVASQGALTRRAVQPATSGRGRQMSSASGIVSTPRGHLLVVGHNDSAELDVYGVGPTGELAKVAGSPFACAGNPTSLVMHPGGRFVYTTNGARLEAFALDPVSGALTPLPGSPFDVGSSPRDLAVDPRGDALYTGHMFGAETGVRVHRLDPTTGVPTFASALTLPGASRPGKAIEVDAKGERLFCLDLDAGLYVATIDPQTRALTLVTGAAPRALGGFAHGLALATRGDKVYATVQGVGLLGFRVGPTGALTAVPGSPVTNVGATSLYLLADPTDRFLFVSSRGADQLHTYAVEPVTGAVVEVPGSPRLDTTVGAIVGPLVAMPAR
ncbi:MAG: lactonase family protein [Planctomycetes bacterium]|nr:lactonase family protein [Planctomycetota bacterium]